MNSWLKCCKHCANSYHQINPRVAGQEKLDTLHSQLAIVHHSSVILDTEALPKSYCSHCCQGSLIMVIHLKCRCSGEASILCHQLPTSLIFQNIFQLLLMSLPSHSSTPPLEASLISKDLGFD
jgi:hypothetical protein